MWQNFYSIMRFQIVECLKWTHPIKGRGKAVIMEEDKPKDMIGKGGFSIVVLLKLLNQPLYMRSVAHLEQLLNLLEVIMIHAESDASLPKQSVEPSEQPVISEGIMLDVNANIDASPIEPSGLESKVHSEQVNNVAVSVATEEGCFSKIDSKEQDPQAVLLGLPQAELQILCSLLAREGMKLCSQNTAPAAEAGASGMQAMALRLAGDKTLIYQSRILGSQDTLFDQIGKHYFYQCYIQGSIDFIFGNARSLYQSIRDDRSVHIFPPFPGCDRRQQYVRVEAVTLHPGGGGLVNIGQSMTQMGRILRRLEFGDPSMFNGDMVKRTKKTINVLSVAAAAIGNCEVEISEYLTHVPNISRTKFEKCKQIFHRP
ncbi:Pectinesterase QRT1 [Platanthera zijinensis]|uniref:Pectinesterase n=1 Tax=Platanthera zijinensis TaxID=2320716 RepID=A0AAP0GFP0_9ASPA